MSRQARAYTAFAVALLALGVYLRREALEMGFVADDYAQLGMVQGHYLLERSPFNLFNFSDGSVEETQRLLRGGFYHWWSHPKLRLSMLRPLASAMIWLDFQLFGNNAFAYHLHSLAWWIAMVAVVAHLFYRLLPPAVAALSLALFVLDEAHGVALSWIANRSAFVTTTLVLAALPHYLRWRKAPTVRGGVGLALVISLALGFGEYALCGASFFLAYELLRGQGAFRDRMRCLSPVVLPCALFVVLRAALGHEPRNSGVYVGLSDPLLFAQALIHRLPVLYSDLLLALRAEHWTFGSPFTLWLLERGWATPQWLLSPEPWRTVHERIGLLSMLVVGLLALCLPKSGRYENARWLALGGALSTLPVVSSFPSSRLLVVGLVGFAPLFATFTVSAFDGLRQKLRTRVTRTLLHLAAACVVGTFHLVVPSALARSELSALLVASKSVRSAVLNMEADDARLPQQRVVVLAAAEDGTSMYIPMTRMRYGKKAPRACWTLSRTVAPYILTRIGPRSLTIRFEGGVTMLASAPEQLLRTPRDPLHENQQVDAGGMRATVLSLLHGRPREVRFDFDVPLEDPSLHFVLPTLHGIKRFHVPPIGQSVLVPAPLIPPYQFTAPAGEDSATRSPQASR